VTRMVVRTRVMSSLRVWKTPRERGLFFSSSSANSRTFHGYSVVMAISTAWRMERVRNRLIKSMPDPMTSFRDIGGGGVEEDVGTPMELLIRGFINIIRRNGRVREREEILGQTFFPCVLSAGAASDEYARPCDLFVASLSRAPIQNDGDLFFSLSFANKCVHRAKALPTFREE